MILAPFKTSKEALLKVENLKTYFFVGGRVVRAVDGLDLKIHHGEVFALVGESGCGKTVTAMSIMGLVNEPGRIVGGEIHFKGQSLLHLTEREISEIRGNHMSLVFQDPQVRLNPVFTLGAQLIEVFLLHLDIPRKEAYERSVAVLESVGIPDPSTQMQAYPYELSLGQAQRVMLALALALHPDLLIADEPTSALDVTIQAQILELIRTHQTKHGTAVLLISHDMGVVAKVAQRVAVMYAGQIIEEAQTQALFHRARHPYTQGLIASIPFYQDLDGPLYSIPGTAPDPHALPEGCRFADRCRARIEHALTICDDTLPDLLEYGTDHAVRCWLYQTGPNHIPPFTLD